MTEYYVGDVVEVVDRDVIQNMKCTRGVVYDIRMDSSRHTLAAILFLDGSKASYFTYRLKLISHGESHD